MKNAVLFMLCFVAVSFIACKKNGGEPISSTRQANLIFKFKFDPTQVRLNNVGGVSTIPAGNAAQNPTMNKMSAHYVELTPTAFTALGSGAVVYKAPETTTGGSSAIDFSKAILVGNNETFLSVPIKDIAVGTYEYLRVSLAYQNLDISFHLDTIINATTISQDFPSTIAGFIGFNTYINEFKIKNQTVPVNANKLQGFWGVETSGTIAGFPFSHTGIGQAPANATTVVNPIFATSPVPQGSCLVTGAFTGGNKLKITGAETNDIVVIVSLSTNKSFEWTDTNGNGKWDATKGEKVVDMGLRGMLATVQ
ncbi:MAG: hypothetical protein ACKVOM_01905 [Ferruginibacter sp.]